MASNIMAPIYYLQSDDMESSQGRLKVAGWIKGTVTNLFLELVQTGTSQKSFTGA